MLLQFSVMSSILTSIYYFTTVYTSLLLVIIHHINRNAVGWDGMETNEMESNGMELNGLEIPLEYFYLWQCLSASCLHFPLCQQQKRQAVTET